MPENPRDGRPDGALAKVDFKKTLDPYRARKGAFRVLEVPDLRYLMLDGHGDPNTSPDFEAATSALYPLAYALKFASKNDLGRDYVVPPLEGLWWAEDMSTFTSARDKSSWSWTLMLLVPDWLDAEVIEDSRAASSAKGAPALLEDVRVETLREGLCVQTLHVGPFDAESPVLEEMHHEFLPAQGLELSGTHHEIYLGDVRRSAPEKLRTILRQPVRRAANA